MLVAVATLVLVLTGCRSSRVATGTTAPTVEEPVYTALTFSGEVDGICVNGQVRMKRGEIIWGSVSKFIELGRAIATPDSVRVRIPMMSRRFDGNYQDLQRATGAKTSFAELQEILESDDAEARIATLAQSLGHTAAIRITKRERKETLNFPFK